MINDKKVLALIPARGGSKGLPRKNILPMSGKPLIAWTIEAAQNSRYIDHVHVSSEDREIIQTVETLGLDVPFPRPTEMATDHSNIQETIEHTIEQFSGYDIMIMLQPTSPLRDEENIDEALELFCNSEADSCVSVYTPEKSPYWQFTLNEEGSLHPLFDQEYYNKQRQELPVCYALNGAIYISRIETYLKNKSFFSGRVIPYFMNRERSVDIDTQVDFLLAEYFLNKKIDAMNHLMSAI